MIRRVVQPRCIKAAASAHVVTAHSIILREFFAICLMGQHAREQPRRTPGCCPLRRQLELRSCCRMLCNNCSLVYCPCRFSQTCATWSCGVRVLRTIGNPAGSCHRSSCTHDVVCHEAPTKSLKQVGAWRLLIVQAQAAAHTHSQLVASNQSKVGCSVAEGVCIKVCR